MGRYTYIFTNSYKPVLGGIQTVTSQVAETFHKRGDKVIVVTKFAGIAKKPISKIENVPIIRLLFAYNIELILLWLMFLILRPKIVYVHFPQEQAKFVVKLRKCFDFKLITCFHGHDALMYQEGYDRNNELYKWKRKLVHTSDKVSACSGYLGKCVEAVFDCVGVVPIYNGVDLSRYNVDIELESHYKKPYIFAFGRLEKIKGYDMLIDAFKSIIAKQTIPELIEGLNLFIAGSGSMHDELQQKIDAYHLSDRIKLIGRKTPTEIVMLSQHAEIIVIPSLREPFGIVVLEAIAAKRPVVATEAGGIPEIMDIRFGELVPPKVDGIANGIEKAMMNLDIYQFQDTEAYLSNYTIDSMVDNYIKITI